LYPAIHDRRKEHARQRLPRVTCSLHLAMRLLV